MNSETRSEWVTSGDWPSVYAEVVHPDAGDYSRPCQKQSRGGRNLFLQAEAPGALFEHLHRRTGVAPPSTAEFVQDSARKRP